MTSDHHRRLSLYVLAAVTAVGIFLFDQFVPLGVAGGVPYVAVVLIGLWMPARIDIWLLASLGSTLTVAGYFLSPEGGEISFVLANRALALLAVLVTAVLVVLDKGARDQLRESEERYRAQYNDSPLPIYTWRHVADGFVLAGYNAAAAQLSGMRVTDFVGRSVDESLGFDNEAKAYIERCFAEQRTLHRSGEYKMPIANRVRSLEITYVFVPPDMVVVQVLDVTERVRAERELRRAHDELEQRVEERTCDLVELNSALHREIEERARIETELQRSEEAFRELSRNDPVPVYRWKRRGEDFVMMDANDAANLVTDGAAARLIGETADNVFRDWAEGLRYLTQCYAEKTTLRHVGNRQNLILGGYRWFDTTFAYSPPDTVIVYTDDITDRILAEDRLRDSERQLRLIADNIPALIAYVDRTETVLYVNKGYEEFWGRPAPSAQGKSLRKFLGDEIYFRRKTYIDQALAGETVFFEGSLADGSETRNFRITYAPNIGPDGEVQGYYSLSYDITDLKQHERQLEDERIRAEAANAAKSRFLAAASHDLRQPIQALNLFVYSLGRKERDAEDRELIDNIAQTSEIMSDLLNALLDISKLDAGVVTPEIEIFPVQNVLDDVVTMFSERAREKGLDLCVVASEAFVESDPVLVERIVRNYVSNALRYTASGRILLGCRRRGRQISLQVWDTGAGIPVEEQQRVFEEFYQLANPERDRSRGLGLGLAIVERTAQLLGHEIGVESEPGKGSVFTIDLPAAVPVLADAALAFALDPLPDLPDGGMIVVVEDDENILTGLKNVLTGAGFEVAAATSSERAIYELERSGQCPDAIIADHRLAGRETGIGAVERLQRVFGADIPGIIVTGDTGPERLREAMEGGCRLLHKPVRPETILRTVGEALVSARKARVSA